MTKRHLEFLAMRLAREIAGKTSIITENAIVKDKFVAAIAEILKECNSGFDSEKFITACYER